MATNAPKVPVVPEAEPTIAPQITPAEKNVGFNNDAQEINRDEKQYDTDGSDNFQEGVNRMRAITSVWSKRSLICMFILFFVCSLADALVVSVHYALNPYVTSSFGMHGIIAVVGIVSTLISGTCALTIAKIIDIWGRVIGFLLMLIMVVVALIMKATAKNIETYMGGYTLFWTGHIGMQYVIDVMIADMTTLKNRMLLFTLMGTPLICSTFAGPEIAERFLEGIGYNWAFGAFAIIIFGVSIPIPIVLLIQEHRAKQAGLMQKVDSGRTVFESIKYYFIQLDILALILVTATFVLILMPFSIIGYAPNGWKTPYIIAMEVVGVVCGVLFYLWEKFGAPVQFLPWKYFKEPTIIGSCLLYGTMFLSVFCWNGYFSSYLQVVHRMGVRDANYTVNAFSLTAAIISPLCALVVKYTGNLKWVSMTGAVPMILGTALLIPYRTPSAPTSVLVCTQILMGLGTGIYSSCAQLAVTVPVTHQQIAVILAIWGMFGGIGSSIGFAISGALWNNILPGQILARLPEESKGMAAEIFGDIVLQMSFADGTPEREAVVGAYAHVQRLMVITGVALMPLVILSVVIWRNVNVKKKEEEEGLQTKGNVY
ncbi:siderophore iron transporter mirB [Plectosphaerella plurivora]|uniref:Siderophore iron transporter mirB n=1 Tax=Plectosphaerella plurivora TaxID=936078 RepID=A0A9P8V6I5_9PEZI|nr:siderophore iron transporter mirB [Plectosphaerella plurivora]